MARKRIKEELRNLLYITLAVVILVLSALNLKGNTVKVEVLGAQIEDNKAYWEELVAKHPTYIDAWLELGRVDKVKEIDPNYFKEFN